MRVLVSWVPDWPLITTGLPDGEPVAVVSGDGRVVACSAAARAAGVRRGMRVRQAQSRCPGLRVAERDQAAETRGFEPVVRRLEAEVMPRLEVIRPGMVAAPARGPARYWGGEAELAARVAAALSRLGHPVQSGAADTTFAAALAARARSGVLVPAGETAGLLAPYPVGVLGRPRLAELLVRLGIGTLGGFAALPSDQVSARFGADGAAAHRTASGREPRLLNASGAEPDHAVRWGFDPAEERTEPLAFAGKALAERLQERLTSAGVVGARVEVEVGLADGRKLRRAWRHEGRLSSLAVAERVRWQVQAWTDAGDLAPAADGAGGAVGVVELVLRPRQLSAATGRQTVLFGGGATLDDLERAAGQVQALLGHRAVTRVELTGGRGPADRVRKVPVGDIATPPAGGGPWPGRLPAPHPATVYQPLLPARLLDGAGQVVSVSGRLAVSAPPVRLTVDGLPGVLEVTAWSAPWPALEQWWDRDRARRIARMQITTAAGGAWLLQISAGRWWAEAHYG
ncbi:DNA polymerase Y family protein [Streptomyces sp. NPDC008079]|uniref:Y-family DNA polymerase n=1 Tax=unclassified Streptomyces TaxID=2593676 RepID=UPI0036E0666D